MSITQRFNVAHDAYITSSDATYATAQAGASLGVTDSAYLRLGQTYSVPKRYIYSAFLNFDTSTILEEFVIESATLIFEYYSDGSTTDFMIEAYAYDFGEAVTTDDWVNPTTLTELLASVTTVGISNPMTFTSEDAFVDAIVKEGTTRLILTSDRAVAGTNPSGPEYVQFYSVDNGTTTRRPILEIVYSVPESSLIVEPSVVGCVYGAHTTNYVAALTNATLALSDYFYLGQYYSAQYRSYEGVASFDTSAIPDDAIIEEVLFGAHVLTDGSTQDFTAEVYAYDFGATITTADYFDCRTESGDLLASFATAGIASGVYAYDWIVFESEDEFKDAINKTGYTRLVLLSDRQIAGTQPSTLEYLALALATSRNPWLYVVWSTPAATGGMTLMKGMW